MHKETFRVVGYYPCWKPEELHKVNYQVLTHINYAFVIPTAEGDLLPLRNPGTARTLIAQAHARGVKVLIVVGGWDYQGDLLEHTFVRATDTPEKSGRLARKLLQLCDDFGFDGIDVDWEYPRAGQPSAAQYEQLMSYLSGELHNRGKLLTCAVFSGVSSGGEILPDGEAQSRKVLESCDFVNVMAYDGGDGRDHSGFEFSQACACYWKSRQGLPGEKINLGLPFYGRPGWDTYEQIVKADPKSWDQDSILREGREICYNGACTIRRKTAYARENLGGVMIWEVTQDSSDPGLSLTAAIGRELQK